MWFKKLLAILAINLAAFGGPVVFALVIALVRRLEKPSDPP